MDTISLSNANDLNAVSLEAARSTRVHKPLQVSESVLQVAARLYAFIGSNRKTIAVTGFDEQDLASDLATQLAIALSQQSGASVAVLDGNRLNPSIHSILDIPTAPGLGEFLAGLASESEVQHSAAEEITAIPSGQKDFPLTGTAIARLFEELKRTHHYVIVAAPPLLLSPDAVTLLSHCDGAVLSLRTGKRDTSEVKQLQRELARLKITLLGAVLRGAA